MNKHCNGCDRDLDILRFSKRKDTKDGLQPQCKNCNKAYEREHSSDRNAWRKDNLQKKKITNFSTYTCIECGEPDFLHPGKKLCSRHYNFQQAQGEKQKKARLAYRQTKREDAKRKSSEWRKANPDKYEATKDAWNKANPEAYRRIRLASKARRRAREGRLPHASDIKRLFVLQEGKCISCRCDLGKRYQVDHIIPVSLGGDSDVNNLQLLCPPCNQSKAAKHPIDFMQSRGYLL